jgi:hypothetical protein
VGGLVYTLIGRPLRKVSGVGPYLAGIVSVAGYMGSIALAATAAGQPMVKDGGDVVALGVISTVFGIVLGRSLFRRSPRSAAVSASPHPSR